MVNNYISDILDFWFYKKLDYKKWFHSKSKHDSYITKEFSDILKLAEKGYLLEWLTSYESYLAMIILMDQFSRHIYRDTSKAYENDTQILLFTEMGLELYLDQASASEKMFILMPYQHSENINDQQLGVNILENLVKNETNPCEKNILKKTLFHQKKHYEVIKKFGRFPKRNIILDRESTEEEIDYIDEHTKYNY